MWCQLGARIMEILTYFSSHSRQVNVATWFLVLPIDKENPYRLSRGWYIYIYIIYMSSSWHHILAISPVEKIEIYRVGDNRGTVNTSTSPHISDQLGTENACLTLLSWFIVMTWVLVCNNMYWYERHFGPFYRNQQFLRRFRLRYMCQNRPHWESFLLKYNDRK